MSDYFFIFLRLKKKIPKACYHQTGFVSSIIYALVDRLIKIFIIVLDFCFVFLPSLIPLDRCIMWVVLVWSLKMNLWRACVQQQIKYTPSNYLFIFSFNNFIYAQPDFTCVINQTVVQIYSYFLCCIAGVYNEIKHLWCDI